MTGRLHRPSRAVISSRASLEGRRPAGGPLLIAAASAMLIVAGCLDAASAPVVSPAASPPASAGSHPTVAAPRGADGGAPHSAAVPNNDLGSRNVAARTRMLECGHQWSAMKKAGTAAGTWKEFSRGCLAQR